MAKSAKEPSQFAVPATDGSKIYLGDATVVHQLVSDFANKVMATYHKFLEGSSAAEPVQQEIDKICHEYGDILMGRNPAYEIAPWQGERMRMKILVSIPGSKYEDDPGEAFFRHTAVQCVKASIALAKGMPEQKVGRHLNEILDDTRDRILGTVQ